MIWKCTEILAVIVECMIVTRMLIQYFKFRSEDYRILKWLLLFSLLFATDMAGTFGIANETFLISSFLLIEIAFSAIFLKGNSFEKILISVINYVFVYFINLPVMSAISAITDISMLQLRDSQNVERIACLFLTKLLFFASTQFILSFRKKEEYHFKRNGLIDFYEKEGMFYVDILLPIEENLHLGNKVLNRIRKCDMIDLAEGM